MRSYINKTFLYLTPTKSSLSSIINLEPTLKIMISVIKTPFLFIKNNSKNKKSFNNTININAIFALNILLVKTIDKVMFDYYF